MLVWHSENYREVAIEGRFYDPHEAAAGGHKSVEVVVTLADGTSQVMFEHNISFLSYTEPNPDDIYAKYASKLGRVRNKIDNILQCQDLTEKLG